MKFTEGFVSGAAFMFVVAVIIGLNSDIEKDKLECEKDLSRNLKCEMVYVKPSIEGK